jgi:lysophospholipase L1-like esterase
MVKPLYIVAGAGVLTGLMIFLNQKVNVKGKRVAVIGDSHSAGYGWGWQDKLSWKYNFELNNLAVGGKTTSWMKTTLENFYKQGNKPDVVFIYGGANDAFGNAKLQDVVDRIQSMVNLVKTNGGIPIVIAGFNYDKAVKPNVSSKYEIGINRYRELQNMIENQIKNAEIVPVWNEVNEKSVGSDGFHLPERVQNIFADYVAEQVIKS